MNSLKTRWIGFLLASLCLLLPLGNVAQADLIKQSTAYNKTVLMISDGTTGVAHISGATGLTLTITESKAAASFGSITPTITELGNGWYKLALTTSHTDTFGLLNLHVTAVGADPTDTSDQVVGFDPNDAVRLGLTSLPNAAASASGGLLTFGTGTGQLNPSGGTLSTSSVTSVATGTAQAGASSTITLQAGSSSTTDLYKGNFIVISSGTGAGQSRVIVGYNGGTLVATVSRAWAINPDSTSVYTVVANPHPALDAALAVTAGTVSDKTGYTLSSIGYQGLLDTALSGHTTVGTVGGALQTASSAGDPWSSLTSAYNTSGTFGKLIKDYLDAAVSSRMATFTLPSNFSAFSIDGTGRVGLQSAEYTSITVGVLGAVASGYNTVGTIGAKINSAASAGDPWSTTLPGSYASGTAGYQLGQFTFSGGNVNSRVAAYASGQDPATLVLAATIDGSLTVKQVQLLSQAVISGKFAVVRNTGAKTLTVSYYRADGTTLLATLITTYSDSGLTLSTGRTVTFSNLP